MALINFTSTNQHVDISRVGQDQTIEFYPLSPNGFTFLQSDQQMGNRSEWWSIDQRTVEVCQYDPRSEVNVIVPCIPEDRTRSGIDDNSPVIIYGKRYWDEWHSSVKFGQEFNVDATGIPGIVDYWHNTETGEPHDQYDFECILKGGTVSWESKRLANCSYEFTLSFTLSLVRSPDQDSFGVFQ